MKSRIEILHHWEAEFSKAGLDSPRLSAQVLLAHVLGISRLDMLLAMTADVVAVDVAVMDRLCRRRLLGEPVAYLLGSKEFYGLSFEVGPEVLIPRPETELIPEYLQKTLPSDASHLLLDLGTGSGALAVTCAALFRRFRVVGVDISMPALHVARRNAALHGVDERVAFVQGDLTTALQLDVFDIIVANLPYVPSTTRESMSREVLDFEPEIALFAGEDGLDCYRRLATAIRSRTGRGCTLFCEIDHSQGAEMERLFAPISREVRIVKDYAGHDRLVVVVF